MNTNGMIINFDNESYTLIQDAYKDIDSGCYTANAVTKSNYCANYDCKAYLDKYATIYQVDWSFENNDCELDKPSSVMAIA